MQIFSPASAKMKAQIPARKVFSVISNELSLIEAEFERQAGSNVQVIAYIADYLRGSGGKRVRPALTILSNYSVGGNGADDNSIRMATVMEFLHTATLVHDDIIDNADTRRNRKSVNARFGNQAAVLMGDWLYMSAFETALQERSLGILDILTRVTRKMTEGELMQLTFLGNTDINEEQYYDILKRKTAFLFSACCEIGAIIGDASEAEQSALSDYGMNLGIAFQLADDLLDFTAEDEVLGKASGADLLEGKITLPLLLLLKKDPTIRKDLEQIMFDGNYRTVPRSYIIHKLESNGFLAETKQKAAHFAEQAIKTLDVLPESRYRDALEQIPGYVIERNK